MFLGFFYVIICIQVWMGFPPLYKREGRSLWDALSPKDEEILFFIKVGVPALAASLIAIFINHPFAMGMAILVGFWCGSRVRFRLKNDIELLLPSMVHPFPLKWPMFAFDLWTFGAVGFFALLGLGR
jgi:ABC-type phosphate transport system permease subunit